jgi:hypothetical protein
MVSVHPSYTIVYTILRHGVVDVSLGDNTPGIASR